MTSPSLAAELGQPTTPRNLRIAAACLWTRAALHMPMLAFAGFYLSHGIGIGGRSPDFPDGASTLWIYYTISEVDNYLMWPVDVLFNYRFGVPSTSTWLVLYAAGAVVTALIGLRLWRGRRLRPRSYHALVSYLILGLGIQLLMLTVVAPGAVDAIGTGENAPSYPYPGEAMIHAYEWLLLPWSAALLASSIAVLALFRTGSARAHLSTAPPPAPASPPVLPVVP